MFVNMKIKHFMLIKYSKKSHKIKNSKRTFLINKKLDIISYIIDLELLSNEDIKSLIDALEICVENKFSYTNEQLFIIKEIINTLRKKEEIRRNAVNLLI